MNKKKIPAYLSYSRIAAVPILLFLAFIDQRLLFILLFAAAALTDLLDGIFARKFKVDSKKGTKQDTIGDLFLYLSMIVSGFILVKHPALLPWLYFACTIVAGYVVAAIIYRSRGNELITPHLYTSKLAVFVACIIFLSWIAFGFNELLALVLAQFFLIGMIEYTIALLAFKKPIKDMNSIVLHWNKHKLRKDYRIQVALAILITLISFILASIWL